MNAKGLRNQVRAVMQDVNDQSEVVIGIDPDGEERVERLADKRIVVWVKGVAMEPVWQGPATEQEAFRAGLRYGRTMPWLPS